MKVLRRIAVFGAVVGLAWWAAARWWQNQVATDHLPHPATPWPPVPTAGPGPAPAPASAPEAEDPEAEDPVAEDPEAEDPVTEAADVTSFEITATVRTSSDATAWMAPVEGACPAGYEVKVKQRSGLYHLPGMVAYARTSPDRCYRTAGDAEADGFTRARR